VKAYSCIITESSRTVQSQTLYYWLFLELVYRQCWISRQYQTSFR